MQENALDLSQWILKANDVELGVPDSATWYLPDNVELEWTHTYAGEAYKVYYSGNDVNFKSVPGIQQAQINWASVY